MEESAVFCKKFSQHTHLHLFLGKHFDEHIDLAPLHLLFEALAKTGADVLSVDEVDLGEACGRVGDRVTLMGNVCPSGALLEGTPQEVEAEAIDCLRKAGGSPRGFILASGCEVPIDAPRENVQALIAAADRWGKLPLQLPS